MKLPRYTLATHVQRVDAMLKTYDDDSKSHCPACPRNIHSGDINTLWSSSREDICKLCLNFVNIPESKWETTCPNLWYGRTAIKEIYAGKIKQYRQLHSKAIPEFARKQMVDKWILKQNLQESIDALLRKYEEKGIEVKNISVVTLPLSKPSVRIDLF